MEARDTFMDIFRSDKINELSNDDRLEVFMSILSGASDITIDNLSELCSDYGVSLLEKFSDEFIMFRWPAVEKLKSVEGFNENSVMVREPFVFYQQSGFSPYLIKKSWFIENNIFC